jgi:uncharacterized protein YeaO (DUF488 family)
VIGGSMPVRIVRLRAHRGGKEGLRLGTVRRPPAACRKRSMRPRDFYDVWLPNLAPSEVAEVGEERRRHAVLGCVPSAHFRRK